MYLRQSVPNMHREAGFERFHPIGYKAGKAEALWAKICSTRPIGIVIDSSSAPRSKTLGGDFDKMPY